MKQNQNSSDNLAEILQQLSARGVTERKVRLLAVACCHRVWHLLPDARSRRGVEATERYADGIFTVEQLRDAGHEAYEAWFETDPRNDDEDDPDDGPHLGNAIFHAANAIVRLTSTGDEWKSAGAVQAVASELRRAVWFASPTEQRLAIREAERQQVLLCLEVFGERLGSPLVSLAPEWRTGTAVRLAQGIDEDRAFDRMPILADALEEAGCDEWGVLLHLRKGEDHVRGCWALDLVLDRT